MTIFLFVLGTACSVLAGGPANLKQEPPFEKRASKQVHQELRFFIYEEFDEESDHEEYEQLFPVEVSFGTRGAAGGVSGKITVMSGCKWRKKEPTLPLSLAFPLFPQDGEPWRNPPPHDPPWEQPPPPQTWTPVTPTNYYNQPLTLTLQVNALTTNMRVGSGSLFNANALNTQGSQITNPTSGGGIVPQPGDPQQPPPPPNPGTKLQDPAAKSILGRGGSDDADDSDTSLLVGPEMTMPLKADVTEWGVFRWLPESTSLSLYGHALFGEMKIFSSSIDVSLYGLGPRFGLPVVREPWLRIDGLISAGPAFLHTDIGDTAGLDFATGLGAQLNIVGKMSLLASLEYRGYFAPDVDAHGPSFNFGLNLGW